MTNTWCAIKADVTSQGWVDRCRSNDWCDVRVTGKGSPITCDGKTKYYPSYVCRVLFYGFIIITLLVLTVGCVVLFLGDTQSDGTCCLLEATGSCYAFWCCRRIRILPVEEGAVMEV